MLFLPRHLLTQKEHLRAYTTEHRVAIERWGRPSENLIGCVVGAEGLSRGGALLNIPHFHLEPLRSYTRGVREKKISNPQKSLKPDFKQLNP